MTEQILLTIPNGLAKELDERMKESKEISRQEFIRKILEREFVSKNAEEKS